MPLLDEALQARAGVPGHSAGTADVARQAGIERPGGRQLAIVTAHIIGNQRLVLRRQRAEALPVHPFGVDVADVTQIFLPVLRHRPPEATRRVWRVA